MIEIIQTGSKGNAVVVNSTILIDCGVPFKKLQPYYKNLQLVLLTHCHSDHLNKSCIKRLSNERPILRFGCCLWLVGDLVALGVDKKNIDVYNFDEWNDYGKFKINAFELFHNVPNCGYKIQIDDWKMIYATDTSEVKTDAKDYDLYLIEANYTELEMQERIEQKIITGEDYIYEYQVLQNHLSKEKADDFIYQNIGSKGEYIYMHEHVENNHFVDVNKITGEV